MRTGDEAACREFFDRHFTRLFRFALVRVDGEPRDAEEVAQATLCKALTRLDSFRGEASLFTWLCTFCRHEISALYASRSRTPEVESEESPEIRDALDSLAAAGDGPEQALLRDELAQSVEASLDGLPERYGDVLRWKYIEGLTVQEIAGRADVGLKAAESLLTRARAAFRDAFRAPSGGKRDEVVR
jgi:RNA polymerase sigma-70 factor (ECF subfamily)